MADTSHRSIDDMQGGLVLVQAAVGWVGIMIASIISVAIGAIVLAWPSETLLVLSVLLGLQFVVFGIARLLGAFDRDALAPGLFGVIGVLMIATGVIILRNRIETLAILATILGIVWIISGAIDVIDAIVDRTGDRRLIRVVLGVVSLVAGLVVVSWPAPTLAVIAWVSGLQLVVFGLLGVVSALALRSASAATAG